MTKLIYTTICSLDGYIEDRQGDFSWARPDEEVFAFVNEIERPIGLYLYGRLIYDTMVYWEDEHLLHDEHSVVREFATIWQAADKIVFSRRLARPSSAKTRIVRAFDPSKVQDLKLGAESDISISGADLAGQAIKAGVVDEVGLLVCPVLVGGGKRALPDDVRLDLEQLEEQRFAGGVVYLRYGLRPQQ